VVSTCMQRHARVEEPSGHLDPVGIGSLKMLRRFHRLAFGLELACVCVVGRLEVDAILLLGDLECLLPLA